MTIYLDYNATAPMRSTVREAMLEVLEKPLNASSAHALGRHGKKIVEDARRQLAEQLNCWPQELIWCSSASEANNAVLRMFAPDELLVSSIEHSSVLNVVEGAELIPCLPSGIIDLTWLEKRLQSPARPKLISVMLVNNETGAIQPVGEVVKLAREHSVLVHSDVVQAVGKMPLDLTMLGVDYATISFHKNGGPQGVAALFVKNGAHFTPFIRGGGQEYNRRAGTENIAAIAGVSALLSCWSPTDLDSVKKWLLEFEKNVPTIVAQSVSRLGNVTCLIIPGLSQEVQLMRLDLAGICVGAGSACTSGKIEPSHVLTAMGISKEEASCAIRISSGWDTKESDIIKVTEEIKKMLA